MKPKSVLPWDITKLFPPLYFYKELVCNVWLSYWPMLRGEEVFLYRGSRRANRKDILLDVCTLHARDAITACLLCVIWPFGKLSERIDSRSP